MMKLTGEKTITLYLYGILVLPFVCFGLLFLLHREFISSGIDFYTLFKLHILVDLVLASFGFLASCVICVLFRDSINKDPVNNQ